jgi:hypothetical protein
MEIYSCFGSIKFIFRRLLLEASVEWKMYLAKFSLSAFLKSGDFDRMDILSIMGPDRATRSDTATTHLIK